MAMKKPEFLRNCLLFTYQGQKSLFPDCPFIILLRFNAVDDKGHCCSAASNPLLYKNFKLCLDFCAAKLPSLHICRRSKTLVCLSVPSFS